MWYKERLTTQLKLKSKLGVIVLEIAPSGPAEKAGLRRGDVILRIDDHETDGIDKLLLRLDQTYIGKDTVITVYRKEKLHKFTIRPEERAD